MPLSTIGNNGVTSGISAQKINADRFLVTQSPVGSVVQVVQAVKTDSYASATNAQWGTIPGLTATITPLSASNKIMVFVDLKFVGNTDESISRMRMMRGTTAIFVGDASGSKPRTSGGQNYWTGVGSGGFNVITSGGFYLDSPATVSPVSYTVQIGGDGDANVLFVNRTESDRDQSYMDSRTASSITLLEIAS